MNSSILKIKGFLLIILISILCFGNGVFAQSISLNHTHLNEYYRNQQLLENLDISLSFASRPLYAEALTLENIFTPEQDTFLADDNLSFPGTVQFHKDRGKLQILPVNILAQNNSKYPYGINDGIMVPARGLQTRIDVGLFFKYSLLSIQLNPEYVYAQNTDFDGYPAGYTSKIGTKFPLDRNDGSLDYPERHGDGVYHRIALGQSSLRLSYKVISLGISTENIWFGPGYKNSLLMTNSAPGFPHITLNTTKPIKTPIGSFEGQLIAGKTDSSGYTPNLNADWRYINAFMLSYNPKWIPGLFLGMVRSSMIYHEDMGSGFGSYLPVFGFLTKNTGGTNAEVDAQRDNQLISVFMRWAFPEAHGEFYFEYGREDHSWDLRDFLIEPAHSNAYVLGLRKLFLLKDKKSYIQFIGELTNLAANQTTINRMMPASFIPYAPNYWYNHYQVKHGYTHKGQMLGSGIGPASNQQTIHVSWNKGLKQIGIELERHVHNNNFWYNHVKDIRANWVDNTFGLFANWNYKHFLFYGKMTYINSKNYQWLYEPFDFVDGYWSQNKTTINIHSQMGIVYRF